MKSDYFAYLPENETPNPAGIELLGSGFSKINKSESYPPLGHPRSYLFQWENGRTLQEYQLIYVTRGKGILETAATEHCEFEAPFVFILFPGVWHRYRPDRETGWDEHWFSFKGSFPDSLLNDGIIDPNFPTFQIGHSDRILTQIQLAHNEIRSEPYGFRNVAASAIMQILSLATSLPHRHREENQSIREVIRQACFRIREQIDTALSPEELARELNVGYTYFRRMFKQFTGVSPKRYHTRLRLEHGKRLLRETDMSITEIADALGFDNPFHLSNWFKKQMQLSPSKWRKQS